MLITLAWNSHQTYLFVKALQTGAAFLEGPRAFPSARVPVVSLFAVQTFDADAVIHVFVAKISIFAVLVRHALFMS